MAQRALPRDMLNRIVQQLKTEKIDLISVTESAIRYLLERSDDVPDDEFFAVLVCCYAEAAKIDLSSDDFRSQLNGAEIAEAQCTAIVDSYQKHKADLRGTLLRIGWHPPHVLTADWKLFHSVKGSSQGIIAQPSYLISLKLQECDSTKTDTKDLVFSCTVEQLQDLVWKLREATKAAQKLASQAI